MAGHRPPVRRGSRTGHRYEPARDRGTRSDGAGRRRRTRARPGPGCGCIPEGWMPPAGAGPHPPAGRRLTVAASGLMPGGEPPGTRMGSTRLATLPRLAASLLLLVYSLFVRYGARVRKPTAPEQPGQRSWHTRRRAGADAAEHGHAQGPAAGACRKAGCHSPAQGHTRQRGDLPPRVEPVLMRELDA